MIKFFNIFKFYLTSKNKNIEYEYDIESNVFNSDF